MDLIRMIVDIFFVIECYWAYIKEKLKKITFNNIKDAFVIFTLTILKYAIMYALVYTKMFIRCTKWAIRKTQKAVAKGILWYQERYKVDGRKKE